MSKLPVLEEIEALRQALRAANATVAELQDALNGMRGIAQQRQKRVEELETQCDPEALVIAYGKGRTDGQEDCRKRVQELERELAETRTRLSGAESAWDTIENLMMGVDDDE